MESPPRKRKPVTYGKPCRSHHGGFNHDFHEPEQIAPSTPRQQPLVPSSRLRTPNKSPTPFRSSVEKSDSGIGEFDFPSSEEERDIKSKHVRGPGKLSKVNKGVASSSAAVDSRKTKIPNTSNATQPNKRRRVEKASLTLQTATNVSSKPRETSATRRATKRATTPVCSGSDLDDRTLALVPKQLQKRQGIRQHQSRHVVREARPAVMRQQTGPAKTARVASATSSISSSIVEDVNVSRAPSQLSTPPKDIQISKDVKSSQQREPPATPPRQTDSGPASSNHVDQPSTPVASPSPSTVRRYENAVTTPKQSRLWSEVLLDEADVGETPSRSFNKLSLAPRPEPMDIEITETPRKRRLIDSLKAVASDQPSSDDIEVPNVDVDMLAVIDEGEELDGLDQDALAETSRPASQWVPSPQIPIVLHKHTYGQQRSYLQDREQSFEALISQPLEDADDITMNHTQSVPTKADQFDMSDDEAGTAGIRSIFELRAAAKSKTFNSDLESLIDDLRDASDSGRSRRQRALIELFKKLQDLQTLSRFTQSGSEYVVFDLLRDVEDPIMIATSAAILLVVLDGEDKSVNATRLCKTGVTNLLVRTLDNKRDLTAVARDRTNNMTKLAQASVAEMHAIMLDLPTWRSNQVRSISPHLLALKGLEGLVRRLRESGNVSEPFLNNTMLSKLVGMINDEALPAIRKNKEIDLNLCKLDTALSMIESCTISPNCVSNADVWTTTSLSKFADSLVGSLSLRDVDGHQIHNLTLRIIVNLADGNEKHADCFVHSTLTSRMLYMITNLFAAVESGKNDALQLDALILALAALTNLVECSDSARRNVLIMEPQLIDSLLKDFVANRKRAANATSLEASTVNVAYGYLAVLIGHLCQNNEAKQRIISQLPNKSLGAIIDAVGEFVAYHQAADRVLGNEAYASFTARLRSVVDALRALDA